MFVHAVYFWLRKDLTPAQLEQYAAGLESLRRIDGVRAGYIGVPAPTDRPVVERGYSRALVLVFADQAAHDAYQSIWCTTAFAKNAGRSGPRSESSIR